MRDGVLVGPSGVDLNYQEHLTQISANWGEFGSDNSAETILYYLVAVGNSRTRPYGASNIAPFIYVGLNTIHTFLNLTLIPNERYYTTVQAYAVSGLYVEVTSNGIYAGLTHSITSGVISIVPYQSSTQMISVSWTPARSPVPLLRYELAMGSGVFSQLDLIQYCSNLSYASKLDIFRFIDIGLGKTLY